MRPLGSSPLRSCIGALLVLYGAIGHGQRYEVWRHYTTSNGLPQNSPFHIELDDAGYMWITTEAGLVRFDGQHFLRPGMDGRKPSLDLRTRQIIRTAKGEMLVEDVNGAAATIVDHDLGPVVIPQGPWMPHLGSIPDRWAYRASVDENHPLPGRSRWTRVWTQTVALDQHAWCALGDGRLFIYGDSTLMDSVMLPTPLRFLITIGDRIYGQDTTDRFVHIDVPSRRITDVPLQPGPSGRIPQWTGRRFLKGGAEWACSIDSGVLYALWPSATGDTLLAEPFDMELPDQTVINEVVLFPDNGIIAVATSTRGLFLYKPKSMRTVGCGEDQNMMDACYGQLEIAPGRVLVSGITITSLIISEHGCQTALLPTEIGAVGALVRDAQGHILYGSNGFLYDHDPGKATRTIIGDTLSMGYSLYALGDSLLVGTAHRIGLYAGGEFSWIQDLPLTHGRDQPFLFREGADGSIWYGSCTGLYRTARRTPWQFAPHPAFLAHCVRSIEFIGGRMFIGTYGQGAFVIIGGQVFALPMDEARALSEVHAFMADGTGHLWMSTNHGLIRTSLADIDRYVTRQEDHPYYAHYAEWAGIRNSEFNGGTDPAWIRLADGRASFPSMDGLVWFDPEGIPDAYAQHPLRIEALTVDGQEWIPQNYLDLSPKVQRITVQFSLPYWGEPGNVRCEYRIPGIQEEWSLLPVGAQEVTIIRPPPGDFRLLIRKVGAATREAQGGIDLPFSVRRPFFNTKAGIALLLVLFGLMVWALVELNNLRLRRRNRWLEHSVTIQTQALVEANKELRHVVDHQEKLISIISHDVVPPLRFVARVANSAKEMHRRGIDQEGLGETLEDLSSSTDKLFANANTLLAWIRNRHKQREPELRSLALHSFVENCLDRVREMAEKKGIRLENQVDQEVIVRSDGDLLGIALNNALLNVKLHAVATLIEVSSHDIEHGHRIIVHDDGIGIPENVIGAIRAELSGRSHHDDKERSGAAVGLGFVIIAECMRAMGGTASVERAEPGTRLILDLPERSASRDTVLGQ